MCQSYAEHCGTTAPLKLTIQYGQLAKMAKLYVLRGGGGWGGEAKGCLRALATKGKLPSSGCAPGPSE